jgi:hypothetical protein
MSTVPGQVYRGNARGIQSYHNPDDGDRDSSRNVSFTCSQLTRLCAREGFIEFSRRKSFKLYMFTGDLSDKLILLLFYLEE